jgi:hypothetical protein
MASSAVRIEIRGIASEKAEAQRDLQRTIQTLEEKLLPRRAARRLMTENGPALVLTGAVAVGLALGLAGAPGRRVRAASLLAAAIAGAIACRLATD